MAKTRLNVGKREALKRLAYDELPTGDLEAKAEEAFEKADALTRDDLEKAYPEEDKKVLRRYDLLSETRRVTGSDLDTGQVVSMFLKDPVMVPFSSYTSKGIVAFTKETVQAIEAYGKARSELSIFKDKRMADYKALIDTSRTFEDVVSVWPGAEKLRESLCGTQNSVVALSSEIIERIQKDAKDVEKNKGEDKTA